MGIEPVLSEKGKGKTAKDFEKTKANTLIIAERLKKRFDWILDFRWAGDITFKEGRRKTDVQAAADRGEEVSFGLNMVMTYLDEKKKKRETQIIMRHKDKPFYSFNLKSWVKNPQRSDLVKQMKGVWILLSSGGTIEKPKAIVLTTLGEYKEECLVNAEAKGQAGRFSLQFAKWAKFTLCSTNIFGEDAEAKLFEKIRKVS